MPTASLTYSADLVRRYDRERFLTALFAPADRREALFALYAFNLEIAKIRETVREPMMGHIRLQWWRETIEGIYAGTVRRHEVAEPLAEVIRAHGLPRDAFDRMIDARMADLEEEPPADLAVLEQYAADGAGTLGMLAARVLGGAAPVIEAAKEVGTAYGLAGILRATSFRARLGRVDLPEALLVAEKVRVRDVLDLHGSPGLGRVVGQIAERARALIASARAKRAEAPREQLSAMLPAVLAERHLKRLASVGYDPFHASLGRRDGLQSLALTIAAWRGRY